MLIDFHTHSNQSDGALAPGELVDRAAERGVSLLAITDHDTVAGYRRAREAPGGTDAQGKPRLVPGIEYSCRWSGTTIHILGLGVDIDHPAMLEGVAVLDQARRLRGEKIAAVLAKRGFEGALAGALAVAGESQLGRPHFAEWMVRKGHVDDHNTAFDRYLGQGKAGDIKAFWPELAQVVRWIVDSGGTAVIAHPLKYRFTGMKLRRLVVDFVAAGGSAIEVCSGRQSDDQVAHLKRIAAQHELMVSVGSDFHRDAPYAAPVGVELAPFADLPGVWEQFT